MNSMKSISIKIWAWILPAVVVLSCNEQLEEYNPNGVTAENFYPSPEGMEAALNAAYTYQRQLYGKIEGHGLMEVGTDIWTYGANVQEPDLATYENLKTDQTWIRSKMWQQCYAAINLCNTALSYIDEAGLAATRRPTLEGELRFLRAWYYWHVAETFGDTHFTLEPTEGIVTTANRTPVETIYEQIFADLDFAITNLPPTTKDYGRVTKPAAEAFAARAYLTRGEYQQARDHAKKVIEGYSFKLLTNYADLWRMDNLRNAEIIWAVNYSTNLTYNSGSNKASTFYGMDYRGLPGMVRDIANGRPDGRYMPTLFLLNLFNEQYDARYSGSFKLAWIANDASKIPAWTAAEAAQNPALLPLVGSKKFAVGDTAVFITKKVIDDYQQQYTTRYRYKVYDLNDVYHDNGTPKDRFHYISLKKFDDPTRPNANEDQSAKDVYLFRLAEMYLIAAEAEMMLGNPAQAVQYVNAVRRRAALPGKTTDMEITEAQLSLDFILDERAREFAGEQMRWFDLKRTGKLVERVRLYNPDAAPNIEDYHVRRPIPQAEIDAVTNKEEFVQNIGYY